MLKPLTVGTAAKEMVGRRKIDDARRSRVIIQVIIQIIISGVIFSVTPNPPLTHETPESLKETFKGVSFFSKS